MLRNKNNRPQMAPSWLKWVLIAFIAYAGFLHFTRGDEKAATQTSTMASSGLAASNAQYRPTDTNVQIGGDIPGNGEEALCGQLAEVKVTGKYPDGSVIETTDGSRNIQLNVGTATEEYPWASGIIGMKTGGVREVLLPAGSLPEEIRDAKKIDDTARLQYRVELFSLSPNVPPGTLAFRATELTIGRGEEVSCGDEVKVHLVLWGPNGQMLYSTMRDNDKRPLELVIGKSQFFYGMDRGVLGMRTGGGRSLVVPPAYLVKEDPEKTSLHKMVEKLPADAIVLADVTLVEKARK